jgi:GntR family transcriptional regulator/MocR family aminotransferase
VEWLGASANFLAIGKANMTVGMTTGVADLFLSLDRTESAPEGLTRQIYAQLRAAILDGRLRAGDRLPPTRALARELGVARLTVATAFDWLRAEGYVYGRVGAGTFVAAAFDQYLPESPAPPRKEFRVDRMAHEHATASSTPPANARLTAWAERLAQIPLRPAEQAEGARYDLRPGVGAAELFPWARWRRVVGWPDPVDTTADMGGGAAWETLLGPVETRVAISAWLRRSRAVRCDPAQVLVGASVQQILALLARLLVEPGQRLLIEDPSYIGFHAAFLAEGAVLEAIPVDRQGLRVDALPETQRDADDAPRLVIVTPSHQYPTGVILAMERRVALLEWARRTGAMIVEDDYDGDLRLEGQPLEALRALDERDEVIYLGTFAKALYPAVRLAFAVLPRWLVEYVARARAASDRHPARRDAIAVARFIESGELERHLVRLRRVNRSRRDALVAALTAGLGDAAMIGQADAGNHLLLRLPPGVTDEEVVREARGQGIAVAALSPHYRGSARNGLLVGFGAHPEERLREAANALAALIRQAPRVL